MAYAPTPLPRSARPGGYPVSNSTENPFAKFFGSSKGANALIGLGTGLLSRPTFAQGLAAGGQGYMQGAQQDDEYARMQAEAAEREKSIADAAALKDKYSKFFIDNGRPDIAQGIVDGIVEPGAAYIDFIKPKDAAKPIEVNGQLVDPTTGAVIGDYRTPQGVNGGVEYGVNPVYGRLEDGTMGMGVIGKDGTLKRIDSEGFQPLGPYDTNALKAAGTAFGKGTGGAQFDAPGAKLIADQTIRALDDIRSEKKGMEEQFGNVLGVPQQMTPAWPGSDKAKFQVAVQRGTDRAFLEAREMLRGGGQITDFESKKAETAITSMQIAMEKGDKAQFEKALDDFEQAVKDGVAKLEQQASAMPGYGGAPNGGGANYVFNPATGRLEPQ